MGFKIAHDYYEYQFVNYAINYFRKETFNAKEVLEKFGSFTMGTIKLTELNLSNRNFIDTFELERVPRYLETGGNNDDRGFFACDHKLYLAYDEFGN